MARPPEPWLVSRSDEKSSEPAVAAGPDGEVFLAYVRHEPQGGDVFVQALDHNGRPKGDRVRVTDVPSAAKTWKGDPPALVVGRNGNIYVGWTRKCSDPEARGTDLVLSVSRDGGRSFEPPVKVNDDSEPASHGMHSLAVDSEGRVVMAWLDERNVGKESQNPKTQPAPHHAEAEPNSEVFTAVSTDGGRTFSPNKKIAGDVCPCCKTSLLIDEGGTVYVSWRQVLEGDHRHMAVASSTDGGVTFSRGAVVSDDQWQLSACPVSGAALSSTGRDQLEVTWYTAGAAGVAGIYSAVSNDRGRTFGQRRLLSSAAAAGTPVVSPTYRAFNAIDNAIKIQDVRQTTEGLSIPDAAVPATSTTNGRTLVAFVRTKGDSPSVWASLLEKK
jgi:hypothetical protein